MVDIGTRRYFMMALRTCDVLQWYIQLLAHIVLEFTLGNSYFYFSIKSVQVQVQFFEYLSSALSLAADPSRRLNNQYVNIVTKRICVLYLVPSDQSNW